MEIAVETGESVEYEDGHRRLWASVLTQAVNDLTHRNVYIRNEVRNWIRSDRRAAGSFDWVCGHFGIDSGAARDGLLSGELPEKRKSVLYYWRTTNNVSQRGLAAMIGVSPSTAFKLEDLNYFEGASSRVRGPVERFLAEVGASLN